MKRALIAGGLTLLAIVGWRAARRSPPAAFFPDAEAARELRVLNEILASRNDNDPRLGTDFQTMSPEAKRLFRRRYHELPAEWRNDRGTIVFLLGRNLKDDEDWAFLREVAAEPPCRGLEDCAKPGSGDDVTLAYPSLMALKQAEHALEAGRDLDRARSVIEAAKDSRMPAVLRLVARIEARFPARS